MVHYLKEKPSSETVIKDFTHFQLFSHCNHDFLDQSIVFNCIRVSWIVICIHNGSYSEFQYNNWKIKAGIFEYLRISLGGNCPGHLCPGAFCPKTNL